MADTRIIPDDILVFHVVSRLPVDLIHSLLKKRMFADIHSNHVIKDHIQPPPKLLFLSNTPCEFCTIDCEAPDDGLSASQTSPFDACGESFKILTSIHGLVCVGILDSSFDELYLDLILWNLMTGEYKSLSKTSSPIEHYLDSEMSFGLYYSSSDDEYKLLCVAAYMPSDYIYSLKSDSWREVHSTYKSNYTLLYHYQCLRSSTWLNENLYFIRELRASQFLIKLDTKTEKFTEIATPSLQGRRDVMSSSIYHCSWRLHSILCNRLDNANMHNVKNFILLQSTNGDGNWGKVKTYRPHMLYEVNTLLEPLHLMRNNKLLTRSLKSGYLYILYPNGKSSHISVDIPRGMRYAETFVSPNRYMNN